MAGPEEGQGGSPDGRGHLQRPSPRAPQPAAPWAMPCPLPQLPGSTLSSGSNLAPRMSPVVPLFLTRSCLLAPLQQPLVPRPGFPEDPRGHWSSLGVVCSLAPPIFLQQLLVHAVPLCKLQPGPFLQADPLAWLGFEAWLESNPICIPRHSDGCLWGLCQGPGWLGCVPPPTPPPRALLSPCASPSQH